MNTERMFRIATTYKTNAAGRSQIVATTHGPIRSARLTYNSDLSKMSSENHREAATLLARKVSGNDAATVDLHSMNDSGTKRDWSVFA